MNLMGEKGLAKVYNFIDESKTSGKQYKHYPNQSFYWQFFCFCVFDRSEEVGRKTYLWSSFQVA